MINGVRQHNGIRAALALMAVLAASQGRAQAVAAQHADLSSNQLSCLDTLSAAGMQRVPVYLTAVLGDSTPKSIGNDADLLAQDVADRIREILGTHPDSLPIGEPTISWRDLERPLQITIRRNGRLTFDTVAFGRYGQTQWLLLEPPSRDSSPRSGAELIARALRDVQAKREPFFVWPDSSKSDSICFALELTRPMVSWDGKIVPNSRQTKRASFLVFSVQVPGEAAAIAKKGNPRPRYPRDALSMGAAATVNMQFVIDTNGRAEVSTIKLLWPDNVPPLVGTRKALYQTFIDATREAIPLMRFEPARIGGCPIRVLVQQPFEFAIAP